LFTNKQTAPSPGLACAAAKTLKLPLLGPIHGVVELKKTQPTNFQSENENVIKAAVHIPYFL